jgi:hypothetical protein
LLSLGIDFGDEGVQFDIARDGISLSSFQNSSSRLTLVLRPEMTMECLLTELLPPFTVLRITPSDGKLAPAL